MFCLANIPKRSRADETFSVVDVQKKSAEDPLFAMKQKEIELRRELLSNPVKVKEYQRMVSLMTAVGSA